MHNTFSKLKKEVYEPHDFKISNYSIEAESEEYEACRFTLNEQKVVYRKAKETPKKTGQFVTFWKRNNKGIIEPLHETDAFDFYIITVSSKEEWGQFIIPKAILIKQGIISTEKKEGKRGFRVYPIWDQATSKQAQKTQDWQLKHFYVINEMTHSKTINQLLIP